MMCFGSSDAYAQAHQDTLHKELQALMADFNVPGSAVIWVQGDQVLLSGAYGYADLEEQRPVDIDQTLIRVGSVSKPFTAIGVLNLAASGRLDLDTDVNTFFQEPVIRDRLPSTVTMRHLLTHTAGFDDRFVGKSARTREERLPLGEAVRALLPDRFIDSGEIAAYSNFGVALAGYVLEHVSGVPFEEFMSREVFQPLGMKDSTFEPQDETAGRLMTGYFMDWGRQAPVSFGYLHDAPAGQMVATGRDMIRFMIHMLHPEKMEDAGVLDAEMVRKMTGIRFTHHPKLAGGYGYLWNIGEFGGYDFFGHDGGYVGASARLFFFPDHHAAMFVAANTINNRYIGAVTDLLINRFLSGEDAVGGIRAMDEERAVHGRMVHGEERADNDELPGFREYSDREQSGANEQVVGGIRAMDEHQPAYTDQRRIKDFAGTWRNTRYSRADFTKFSILFGILGNEMKTWALGDSLLAMPDHTGESRALRRVGPDLFQSLDDDYMMAFRIADGKVTHAFTSGTTSLERLHPVETVRFQIAAMLILQFLFTAMLFIYPILFMRRKIRKEKHPAGLLSGYEWVISLIYVAGLWLYLPVLLNIPLYEVLSGFSYGLPGGIYALALLPYIALIATILMAIHLLRDKPVAGRRKAWSVFVLAASVVYFLILDYWNLAGWPA